MPHAVQRQSSTLEPINFEKLRDEINKEFPKQTALSGIERASFLPFQHSSKESQMLKIDALRKAKVTLMQKATLDGFGPIKKNRVASDLSQLAHAFILTYEQSNN